ncbi:MAG: lysylphosphatidylglycerol synthase transmembrane domain-containing protein [Anaerolineae bacterium]|nr:lysylphosphatidylglycerol synthase transmembrane domain-containing protein [Anaerolineae bacterium]
MSVRRDEVILQNQEGSPPALPLVEKKPVPWIRLLLALALSLLGLWYVTRNVSAAELQAAIGSAHPLYILLGLLVFVTTTVAKTWRWRLLYHPQENPPRFPPLFWAVNLGQLVNMAVPFLRLGELARVYYLGHHTGESKVKALGTLVVEKALELISLAFLLFVLLPFFVLPDLVADSGLSGAIIAVVALFLLMLVARRTALVRRVALLFLRLLPERWQVRFVPWLDSGLEGLGALRSGRVSLNLLGSTLVITVLSVATPYVLFSAFDIPLDLKHAAAVHIALTVGALPPSTPARIGVFEGIVTFMLVTFDVGDGALRLAYALVFHLVIVLPQLLLGGFALMRRQRHG